MKGSLVLSRVAAPRRRGQGGIALVLVLWVIALLTTIAMALVTTSRTEMSLARNRVDEARFRAAAEAALSHVILRLSSGDDQDYWVPDGAVHEVEFAGQLLRVQIFNESSRLDLNKIGTDVLTKLVAVVAPPEAVDGEFLAAAVRDWRDPDSVTEMVGAEDDDYRGQGLPYGSADRPFSSVEELNQVLGVDKTVFGLLAEHLTVHASSGRPDLTYASAAVREALDAPEPDPSAQVQTALQRGGPVFRVRVRAGDDDGGQVMETLFRLSRGRDAAVTTYWRRYDWLEASNSAPAGDGG